MAQVPFPSNGNWVINDRGRLSFNPDWYYYTACSGTTRFLYGLFAGHSAEGPGGPQAREATHIHVFDWSGRLRAVWALDRPLSALVVSGDTVMYAAGQAGDGVFRYRLPQVEHAPLKITEVQK